MLVGQVFDAGEDIDRFAELHIAGQVKDQAFVGLLERAAGGPRADLAAVAGVQIGAPVCSFIADPELRLVPGDVGDGVALAHVAEEIGVGDISVKLRVGPGIGQRNGHPVRAVGQQIGREAQLNTPHRGRVAVKGVAHGATRARGYRAFAEQVVVVAPEADDLALQGRIVIKTVAEFIIQRLFRAHARRVRGRGKALVDPGQQAVPIVKIIDRAKTGQQDVGLV